MSVDKRELIKVLSLFLWVAILLASFTVFALAEGDSYSPSLPWVQTNGPCGGYIGDIAIDSLNPSILYAVGSREGIYKSTDAGNSWQMMSFSEAVPDPLGGILIDPIDPSTLYCASNNCLLKSIDGGVSWQNLFRGSHGFENCTAYVRVLEMDPFDNRVLYVGGGSHCPESGGTIYKTDNGGASWKNIGRNLNLPARAMVEAIGVVGGGRLLVGVNDQELQRWGRGKVFYSGNNGQTWREVDFGQTEDRFIFSVFVNPFNLKEVWISGGPLHNDPIKQPLLYKSSDGGVSWKPIYIDVGFDCTQVRVIGASLDGRVYVSGGGNLFFTKNGGLSFRSIDLPPGEMTFLDFTNIAVHPSNPDILFLPLRAGGIAYSENGGINWMLKNNGILNTSINLLAVDPQDPRVVYAVSSGGEGSFRTDDYGESWQRLNKGGIKHPWMDELQVDPSQPSTIWQVTDTATIYKSIDKGERWFGQDADYLRFRFSSVYALASDPKEPHRIYGSKNGFGIFRSERRGEGWKFLRESVDYTYSIVIDPERPNILYSGYNKKLFEARAKITKSTDYGEHWEVVFEPEKSEAITSLAIDPHNSDRVYAGCTGGLGVGGRIYVTRNKGERWTNLNPDFTFATIHALAVDPRSSEVVYAGAWDGGLYKTLNKGKNWHLLAHAPLSTSKILIDPQNSDILYAADRIGPRVFTSKDGGKTWEEFFNAGSKYSTITAMDINPKETSTLYVAALGKGLLRSSLFKIDNGKPEDITGYLTGAVISMAIDKKNPESIYVALEDKHLYHSEDGGKTWNLIMNFPQVDILDLKINEENSSILYAAGVGPTLFAEDLSEKMRSELGRSGIYKSTDAGKTWVYIGKGRFKDIIVKDLIVDRDNIFAATEEGIFFSSDAGGSFKDISESLSFKDIGVLAKGEDSIYLGTYGGGVYRSDEIKSKRFYWKKTSGPRPNISNIMIRVHPEDPKILYASSYPGGFFLSEDGGISWHERNLGSESFMGIIGRPTAGASQDIALVASADDPGFRSYYPFDVSSHNPDILYLGVYGAGLYRSSDGANTWQEVLSLNGKYPSLRITSVKIDEYNGQQIYITSEEGVFVSPDNGLTWNLQNRGLPIKDVYSILIPKDGEVYVGTRGYGVFRWNKKHTQWIQLPDFGSYGVLWPVWDNRPLYQYTSLLIDPGNNDIMYFGTFPAGIYKSIDGGKTWKEKNVGWTNDGVMSLTFHPQNSNIIFAGTYNGINVSWDAVEHWQRWDKGWPAEQWVFSIDFDPQNPDIMYAASKNGANMGRGENRFHGTVMKSTDGGASWFEITNGLNKNNEFYKIIVDRFDSKKLYLATQGDGIFISKDAGKSWKPWNEGLTNLTAGTNGNNVTNTLQLSSDGRVLYFGTAGSGVFRTQLKK